MTTEIKTGDVLTSRDLRPGCHLLAHSSQAAWRVVELGDKAIVVVNQKAAAKRWILMREDITS